MDLPVVLLFIILVIAAVAAAGAWRRTANARLRDDVASAERRLLEGVERLRESLDGAMRDGAQEGSKAQRELATSLSATIERTGGDIQKTTVDRFLAMEQRLADGISETRRSQDERLEKVDARLQESHTAFLRSADDLKTSLLAAVKDQVESHNNATTDLRERVGRALGDFGGEVKGSLGEVQRSQEGRLDRVEEALQRFAETSHKVVDELKTSLLLESKNQIEAQARATSELRGGVTQTLGELAHRLTDAQTEARKEQTQALLGQKKALEDNREAQVKSIADLQAAVGSALDAMREAQAAAFSSLQDRVHGRLEELRKDNETKLEKIRSTVEEKLQATLEARLGESFRHVSDQLEQVYKGLGEMRTLATGVGDLKRVLTNVRSRGAFGEVQLAGLLEQFLSPEQYASNVATVPGSSERVEFAIKLPGRDDSGSIVFLPIDAKFPQEDYQRLQQAFEEGNAAAAEESRKALRQRALIEAKAIQEKYLAPPHTTEFALLFLPTEGLYAEILRIPGLADEMQRRYRVAPVGPTNLFALLNSLQMGFRTLVIEKRSSEVWRILGAVKTEFAKFGESLDAVSKKLQEAGNKIEDAARRSRAVERKLRQVEALPEGEAANLLPAAELTSDDEAEGSPQ